ncbi:uncharacterized protein PRCAT00001487001 [Priceomyces carsonii]|uniref:uncharacterized protein n=1 Tax=Priceomyces carsonii TaxID=28549 RepID=UPI002ED92D3C|nr:unnamed protein product [Priceomyces carsonii]
MTSVEGPKKWKEPVPTKYDLDWADLSIIDLSTFDEPGGKEKLASDLERAVKKDGFWTVVGTGISESEMHEFFGLGQYFFDGYSDDEKKKIEVDFLQGNYFGYKKKGNKNVFGTSVKDNVEILNIAKFTKDGEFKKYHKHKFVQDYHEELETVSKRSFEVVRKLLVLFAIILELDENYFVDRHLYDDPSDDHVRFMKYHPRSKEDDAKVENTWSRGHTDFGSLTLLYNQVVSGLQIKLSDGLWKYVPPVKGGIICNIGDTLNFWSGGYFKSTIHRVVRPPPDQVNAPRIGAFYFVRPGDNAQIEIAPSPVLKRLGLYKKTPPVIGTDYVRARVKNYHDTKEYLKQNNVKFKVGQFEIADGFD